MAADGYTGATWLAQAAVSGEAGARAKEMILLGRTYGAEQLLAYGFVNETAPDTTLVAREGEVEPLTGRTWKTLSGSVAMDLNDVGVLQIQRQLRLVRRVADGGHQVAKHVLRRVLEAALPALAGRAIRARVVDQVEHSPFGEPNQAFNREVVA